MKRLLSLLTVAGAVAGAVWYFRQQGEGQPAPAAGEWAARPKLKAVPDPADVPAPPPAGGEAKPAPAGDDLTEIKGIGPKYAQKLNELGIASFEALAEADHETLANQFEPRAQVADWIAQAQERSAG